MILIYITCKNKEEAKKIGKDLLKKRLVACVNVFPIESLYWWGNRINEDKEAGIILKTKKEKFEEIKKEVKELHSYNIPCIVAFDIFEANKEYLNWIEKEVK